MMKSQILKISFGAALAIYLAEALNLQFPLAAGVIVILSLGETKKRSLDMARIRLTATVAALCIGSAAFWLFGFNPLAFGAYLLVFLPLAYRFGLRDGIVVNSVLVTHLLAVGSIGPAILLNSAVLMLIGAGTAILLNSFMPNMMPKILSDQHEIEAAFKTILAFMAAKVKHEENDWEEEAVFQKASSLLKAAKKRADDNRENYLTRDYAYYSRYIAMRFLQFELLVRMSKTLGQIQMTVSQTELVAQLTKELGLSFHEQNDGVEILGKTVELLERFRQQDLPKTREEFENRARLFIYLGEIRHFIEIKQEFVKHVEIE